MRWPIPRGVAVLHGFASVAALLAAGVIARDGGFPHVAVHRNDDLDPTWLESIRRSPDIDVVVATEPWTGEPG